MEPRATLLLPMNGCAKSDRVLLDLRQLPDADAQVTVWMLRRLEAHGHARKRARVSVEVFSDSSKEDRGEALARLGSSSDVGGGLEKVFRSHVSTLPGGTGALGQEDGLFSRAVVRLGAPNESTSSTPVVVNVVLNSGAKTPHAASREEAPKKGKPQADCPEIPDCLLNRFCTTNRDGCEVCVYGQPLAP